MHRRPGRMYFHEKIISILEHQNEQNITKIPIVDKLSSKQDSFFSRQCFIYSCRRSSSIRADLSGPRGSLEAVEATSRKPAQISSPTLLIFDGEIWKPWLQLFGRRGEEGKKWKLSSFSIVTSIHFFLYKNSVYYEHYS